MFKSIEVRRHKSKSSNRNWGCGLGNKNNARYYKYKSSFKDELDCEIIL